MENQYTVMFVTVWGKCEGGPVVQEIETVLVTENQSTSCVIMFNNMIIILIIVLSIF
jgi:hypothetical protein